MALDDLIADRMKKLARLKEAGVDPYPARTKRTHAIGEAMALFESQPEGGAEVAICGRIMSFRDQGGVMFLDVRDESGQIQAVLKKDDLKNFDLFKETLDRGDFVAITGALFITNRGQKSVAAHDVQMLTKSLRPLPSEWYGVEDEELRFRKRYVELAISPETREVFRKKSVFWQSTREHLLKAGFLEVETPVLEPVPGGAEAEPFVTHHNALDTDFYLRISPELNLKRLMVGGFDRVFEIGRIFRNEGISMEHLQDYTQMEMYWGYQDYNGLMEFVEGLVKHVIQRTFGMTKISRKGVEVDWSNPWKRYDYYGLFKQETGLDLATATQEELFAKAKELNLEQVTPDLGRGRLIDLVYKKTVRPKLVEPGFLINPPVDIEPLAKRIPGSPDRVERFQIMAYGTELGKGFSELNDPVDQRGRFEEQQRLREAGDAEAQFMDTDYVEALEYGMPPTAGFAYSERLFAVLMDKPIRETVFFPLMRPEGGEAN